MICEIDGCSKIALARKWCKAHYLRWYRGGDPLGFGGTERGAAAKFYQETVLAHNDDACLIWPFSDKGNGYAQLMHDGRPQVVSRMVCQEVYGPPPSDEHQAA